jgi:DNA-binding NarL/FixJ family response regulator
MIENQDDMEVVSEIIDPVQLLLAVRITMVDIVIVTPLAADEEPRICRHLLAEFPKITVVTLSVDGEAAYLYRSDTPRLYIANPSGQSILNAIRDQINPDEKNKTI